MTAQHDTPFGVLPGSVVIDFAIIDAAAHAWDLSASLGRAIEFPARLDPGDDDVVALTCTEHTVELGPDQAADRAARGRHRHRAADGRRGSHRSPLVGG